MKFSWRQLRLFEQNAISYPGVNGHETKARFKVKYAIDRVLKQIRAASDEVQARLTDIEIDCCEVDEKGFILRDDKGGLVFTREGLKRRNQLQTEYLEAPTVEIEPFFVEQVPDDMQETLVAVFTDLILRPRAQSTEEGG